MVGSNRDFGVWVRYRARAGAGAEAGARFMVRVINRVKASKHYIINMTSTLLLNKLQKSPSIYSITTDNNEKIANIPPQK